MELALLVLKPTILLLAAMGVAFVYRRTPGRVHDAWTIAFAAILALPLLAVVLPRLSVPVPSRWSATEWAAPVPIHTPSTPPSMAARSGIDLSGVVAAVPAPAPSEPLLSHSRRMSFVWPTATTMAKAVWLAGTVFALTMIVLSLYRVRRVSASAEEMRDPDWLLRAAAIGRRLRLRHSVRLVVSDQIETPMAGGFRRPTVFLPTSAVGWSAERRSVVLAHELVHLARRDPLRHLATRLTLGMYWFNPLVWIAARSAALACENACDESVVRLGIRPSSYARVLLELAESAGRSRRSLAALPIVRRSRLERRLVTILNLDARPLSTGRLRSLAVGCAVFTLVLAAAHPSALVTPSREATAGPDVLPQFRLPGPPMASATAASLVLHPPSGSPGPRDSRPTAATVSQEHARSSTNSVCATNVVSATADKASEFLRRGGMVVAEQVEPRGFTRVIRKSFGDLQVCLFAEAAGESLAPSEIVAQAARTVLEAETSGTIHQLELRRLSTGRRETTWRQNGVSAPVDSTVDTWRRHMLGVLDTTWELAMLHGEAQSLEAKIRSIEIDRRVDGRVAALRERLRALDHDRRTTELEVRRQNELTELRRAIEAKARQAESIAAVPVRAATGEMPHMSALVTAPSACDPAASWASVDAGGTRSARRRPRFLRETFGDLRICLRIDEGNVFETVRPSTLMPRAGHSVLEAQLNGVVQRLELTRDAEGVVRADWRVNGVSRPIDAAVETWRTRIVDVLDTSWEIFALQGQEGHLLGQMSLVHDTRKVESLRAQINSLKVEQRIAEWNSLRAGQVESFRAAIAVVQ